MYSTISATTFSHYNTITGSKYCISYATKKENKKLLMLTGCVVIYFQLGTGWGGNAAVGPRASALSVLGARRWGRRWPADLGKGWGFPGSSFIPNHGVIWLNRVTVIPSAVLSRAVGVPSTQNRSSHDNGLIFSEPLQIKSRKVETRSASSKG